MSLTLDNPVFRSFAFYATLSILKMFSCAFLTSFQRGRKGAYANPEDRAFHKLEKKLIVPAPDDDVERVRRNHLNDIENIIPFVLIGFFYVAVNPSAAVALWHFRIFFISRLVHYISYQMALQPFRGIGFMVGLLTTFSMAWSVISATM